MKWKSEKILKSVINVSWKHFELTPTIAIIDDISLVRIMLFGSTTIAYPIQTM